MINTNEVYSQAFFDSCMAELAALKAEQTELRACLQSALDVGYPENGWQERAEAVLAKGKPDAAAAARQNQEDAIRAGS